MRSAPTHAAPGTARERLQGLADDQAAHRLAAHGPNVVTAQRAVPLHSRVFAQLRDPLIMVLLGAIALTLAIGDYTDSAVIALVVLVNTTVGVVQEVRADHAVAALSAMSAPTARVRRGGVDKEVPSTDVVPDDVLVLSEGDIVPADARLVHAAALLIDESMLTGESVPVDKSPQSERPEEAVLRAGTIVVRGRGTARVTATGADSALGRIARMLDTRPEPTPLQRRLAALGRVLAVVTLALCLVVFVLGLLRGTSPATMAVTAISLAVAAVPESLPAVVTLALALGARRMAARHALVRRLSAVETLGSVTVLATDKTGTLTEGRMVVEHVWTPAGEVSLTGAGYEPTGEVRVEDRAARSEELRPIRGLLTVAALCNDAELRPPAPVPHSSGDGRWTAIGDPTEAALLTAAAKAGCLEQQELRARCPRTDEEPFDSVRKRMTTVHDTPDGRLLVCLKGAPEAVLDPVVLNEPLPLLQSARGEAAALAAQGFRVLAVASAERGDVPSRVTDAEAGLRLLGLAALADPPKAAAAGTLADCRAAGITPVLITGDHPATASAIAGRVGLITGADPREVVTGQALTAGQVPDLTDVRVFARTDPKQKLDIVQAWRARGHVTAMTGDGVNDGPALRQADIGVAMGRRGTEVARQAADLVLTDDELSTVVSAVEEGRRVYDNIRRFLLYGLAGGAAEILVMLLGPLLGLPLPLRAGQILWINLLTHGLTGVAMGAEPVAKGTMRRAPRPPDQHVLGDGLWQRLLFLALVVTAGSLTAALVARATAAPWQSVLFLSLLLAQLGVVLGLRDRLLTRENLFLPAAVAASAGLAAAALYLPALRTLLGTVPLGWREVALALAGAGLGFLAARLSGRLGELSTPRRKHADPAPAPPRGPDGPSHRPS
ncbi:cation-translocating P-type ATPase [Streptomyces ficellus]|uniref:Cation-transporting P-type ATPase n=1 Tax=Streptomyces ficellus TaxID=1977088 RepID=A0A6I6F8R6_9ACTN|nr:cation-transporting P-type ATPase [Streptomyces ficellus]QGV77347.1 cation-transporting P-type ATPase [Streptomyces ficellus]